MSARTSSGFRVTSAYHEKCVAESTKRIESVASASASSASYSTGVYRNCNQVAQGDVWKELVRKEKHSKKAWEDSWGYTALFDPKGEPKPQKQLPDKVSYYNGRVPTATSQMYGSRLNSPSGHSMWQLERMMSSNSRPKTDVTRLPCD